MSFVAFVLIGLLDFPLIYAEPSAAGPTIDVHQDPSPSSRVVAYLTAQGIRRTGATSDGCAWERDVDVTALAQGCIHTESGYEIPAIGVFARSGQWFQVALDNKATQFGWVRGLTQFHSLTDLLASDRMLTHFTRRWDRRVYRNPGRDAAALPLVSMREEVPYKIKGHRFIEGRLWLQVDILDQVCEASEPRVTLTAWVPAQAPGGEPWAWFWSRGC